ncbi:MAG TPA: hypothetical protein VGK32_04760 [Vicinamibacterales bacterium]|jgi:hypothetical protein
MKRVVIVGIAVLALTTLASAPRAQDKGASGMSVRPVAQTPEWQKLRTLVGEWDGSMEEGGKKLAAHVDVRMTGDGSAVMHVLGRDTPHEMVTMFHPDGQRLLATHYCAAHNQPRMELIKAPAANQVAFEFVDGTNIGPGDGHMKRLVITFTDPDHHDEAWTSEVGGKDMPTAVFSFTRKK